MKTATSKRAFDTVCDLAIDPGLVGVALKALASLTARLGPTSWILHEADRWENPWKFLLGVSDLPKGFRLLFAAANSQREALLRFSRKAQKTGSINASWYGKLLVAQRRLDVQGQKTAMKKIFAGMYRVDRGQFLLAAARGNLDFRAQVQGWINEMHARDVRRLGRAKADEEPKQLSIADCFSKDSGCHKVAFIMTCGWLRGDKKGFPGLCFCSDEVIAALLRRVMDLPVQFELIRKLRHRLKLKKASVVVRKLCPNQKRQFELSDSRGKAIWRGIW